MERYVSYMRKMIEVLHLEKLLMRDKKTLEMVEILYRRQDKHIRFIEIWSERIFVLVLAVGIAVLFFFVCLCQETPQDIIVNESQLHPGDRQDEVTFGIEAEAETGIVKDEITVGVGRDDEEQETEGAEATPDPDEQLLSEIREAIESAVSTQRKEDPERDIILPVSVSGADIKYVNPGYQKDFTAFYLCLFTICLFPFLWKRKCQEKLKERDSQLLLDYPELVNKVMLLLSAGLTVRGCFERISREYRSRMGKGGERRYVYEEVCVSLQEMEHGVSEHEALESFGKRCRMLPYLRFSSMLNQNIQKGSEGLLERLEVEAAEAFEKRKEHVKVMGETAGTKLLLPMVLMLGVVMAIIIVPAFMAM